MAELEMTLFARACRDRFLLPSRASWAKVGDGALWQMILGEERPTTFSTSDDWAVLTFMEWLGELERFDPRTAPPQDLSQLIRQLAALKDALVSSAASKRSRKPKGGGTPTLPTATPDAFYALLHEIPTLFSSTQ